MVTVAAESAVVAGGSRFIGSVGLVLVLLATAGWALVVSDTRVEEHPVWVAIAIGTAYAISVAAPPRNSHDLWSYVMYGRMVSAHHLSPYSHVPIDFLHDPFLGRVAAGWRHTSSVYGPVFTGVSAALTRVRGRFRTSRARLAFQGLATIGVIATLAVIRRTTRSTAAVAFVGLHPVMVIVIVNGGHNDALVGPRGDGGRAARRPATMVRGGLRGRARDAREGLGRPRTARPRRVELPAESAWRGAARSRGRSHDAARISAGG